MRMCRSFHSQWFEFFERVPFVKSRQIEDPPVLKCFTVFKVLNIWSLGNAARVSPFSKLQHPTVRPQMHYLPLDAELMP